MKQRFFASNNYDVTTEVEFSVLIVFNCDILTVNYPETDEIKEAIDEGCYRELEEAEGTKLLSSLYINREEHGAEFFYHDHYLYVQYDINTK